MNGMNKLTALAYRQGEESPPRRGSEHPDRWRCCVRRCKDGLHEPASCTKICTKPVRLAFEEPSARIVSLYFAGISDLCTGTYKR